MASSEEGQYAFVFEVAVFMLEDFMLVDFILEDFMLVDFMFFDFMLDFMLFALAIVFMGRILLGLRCGIIVGAGGFRLCVLSST